MNTTARISLSILFVTTACLSANSITHEQLKQYATSLKGLKKAELKTVIYKIAQPASVLYYVSGNGKTWYGFYTTDRIASNHNEVRNRYSSDKFYFP